MALRRITPSMSIDEAATIYLEWKELHDECVTFVIQHPERAREARANFVRAYVAAHQGILMTDRAALAFIDKEDADAEPCPYPRESDEWSIWQALRWALEIKHTRAIRELSAKLTRMTMHDRSSTSQPTPQPERPRINRRRRNTTTDTDEDYSDYLK
jgi:hypothetical protein